MNKNNVLRDYIRLSDAPLGDFALHIAASLTNNSVFPTPPTTPSALITEATEFSKSVAACVNGTPAQTADKNGKRASLIAVLNQVAAYVELTANNDVEKMLASGFNLASTERNQQVPGMTSILSVTNVASTKLGIKIKPADNAWVYVVEYTSQPGGVAKTMVFTSARGIVLDGLTPGTVYSIRIQVMGSSNQRTEWCIPVTHMST